MRSAPLVWLLVFLALSGCAAPITTRHLDPQEADLEMTRSALSSDQPSEMTRTALRARGLLAQFEADPEAALKGLHEIAQATRAQRDIFALAEASFQHAREADQRAYHLAAALYALAFLFPDHADEEPSRFDPRTRLATDVYNAALVEAFRSEDREHVEFAAGVYLLPFGELELGFASEEMLWAGRQLRDLQPVGELEVKGIRNRYRAPGIGAPLAAGVVPSPASAQDELIGPNVRVSLTALLRVDDASAVLTSERLKGRVEIYAANDAAQIELYGEQVPLQYEYTATLGVTLAQPQIFAREIAGFFGRAETGEELPLLRALTPHSRGKIPVVFVHGTASSPGRWADMVNDLWSSRAIRERFEPWFFMYDTGSPITYSASGLRGLLTEAVEQLDPQGSDACLRRMVVIGHSQGGLLTKLTAVDSGDRLWNAVARKPIDELRLSPDGRIILRSALFVQPLPFVKRVVFIATPHRGSYQTLRRVTGWIKGFIRAPQRLAELAGDIATLQSDGVLMAANVRGLPTSLDNMREDNPFLKALLDIPVAPGVGKHSIIPVLGDGPIEEGLDGIVAYRSAHLDDIDSELVVKSGHSTQAEPATIEEVRRILDVHAEAEEQAGLRCGPETGPEAR